MADTNTSTSNLLSCVRSLVDIERNLNNALTKAQALLGSKSTFDSSNPPMLPTPTTMSQVETILALARTYSSRTSAPAGWNPTLPVITFATPNPLPHQLRGGSLGAMQLKMARKTKRHDEEARKQALVKQIHEKEEGERRKRQKTEQKITSNKLQSDGTGASRTKIDPNAKNMESKTSNNAATLNRNVYPLKKPQTTTTMNLSSSESSSSDDDSDSDDDESSSNE